MGQCPKNPECCVKTHFSPKFQPQTYFFPGQWLRGLKISFAGDFPERVGYARKSKGCKSGEKGGNWGQIPGGLSPIGSCNFLNFRGAFGAEGGRFAQKPAARVLRRMDPEMRRGGQNSPTSEKKFWNCPTSLLTNWEPAVKIGFLGHWMRGRKICAPGGFGQEWGQNLQMRFRKFGNAGIFPEGRNMGNNSRFSVGLWGPFGSIPPNEISAVGAPKLRI